MGNAVVHFEIMGKDAAGLQRYYQELFGWEVDTNNPVNYGMVPREGNVTPEGIGIGGGIAAAPEGYQGGVTFYVEVPDVEAGLAKAESLGGSRLMGPDKIMDQVEIGMFTDPEGNPIGLVKSTS